MMGGETAGAPGSVRAPCSGTVRPVSVPRSETRLVCSPATLAMPPSGAPAVGLPKVGSLPWGRGTGEWCGVVQASGDSRVPGGGQGAVGRQPEPTRAHVPQGSAFWPAARSSCRVSRFWSRAVCSSAPRTSPTLAPTPVWPPTRGGRMKPQPTWWCGVSARAGQGSFPRLCMSVH